MRKLLLSLSLALVMLPMVAGAQTVEVTKDDPAVIQELQNRILELTIRILQAQIAQLTEQIRIILQAQNPDEYATGGIDFDSDVFDSPAFTSEQNKNNAVEDRKLKLKNCLDYYTSRHIFGAPQATCVERYGDNSN